MNPQETPDPATGSRVHQIARDRAAELPLATREYPFGPQTEVFKVRGKVFLLLGTHLETSLVTVKSRPCDAVILSTAFDEIRPGYHMNKRHWISIRDGSVPVDILTDLVTESYLLVVAGLPASIRPVDPNTFGQTPSAEFAQSGRPLPC